MMYMTFSIIRRSALSAKETAGLRNAADAAILFLGEKSHYICQKNNKNQFVLKITLWPELN